MMYWSFSSVLFSIQLFVYFLLLLLSLSSSFIALWSDRMQGIISIFLHFLMLALCHKIQSTWSQFHGLLRRMYIVLLPDKIFSRYQLGPFDLWCHLSLAFLCWFFCLDDRSTGDRGVFKSPTSSVLQSICILSPLVYVWWNWVHWHWVHVYLVVFVVIVV
jgi:hypothetical protein